MKLIAHRGNLNGPNSIDENKPEYILDSIYRGFDCEIDVRFINNELFLGHDSPQYKISIDFLLNNSDKFWIHCKNIDALDYLLTFPKLNIFWHNEDEYTLTSKKYIWCYPGKLVTNNSIIVMPEWNKFKIYDNAYGICTDFVHEIKISLNI
jgi:hypothetical protein